METNCPVTQLLRANPIGRLMAFQNDPYLFFDRHKPTDTTLPVQLRLGFRRVFFCYDPRHAQHVLQDHQEKYDKSSLVLQKIKSLSGRRGLIQLKGPEAYGVRNLSARLMNNAGMSRLAKKVDGFINEIFPLIDAAIEKKEALDLVPHLTRIVLRTAGTFVLNHDLVSESDKLNAAFVDLNRRAGEGLRKVAECPFSPGRRRSLHTIHTELDRIAAELERSGEPSLLKSMKSNTEDRSFIRDQLKAFMFAGYDTTASSLIFATYLVAAHPKTQNEIALEGMLSAKSEAKAQYQRLKTSALVHAAYKESLRLYPSAYFLPRESNQDDVMCGVRVPKGSQVFLSVRHIQRHPDYFERPDEFEPSRFLGQLKHPFSFLPFGGGSRICIGAALAKMEASLVLQKLCVRYEMQPASPHPPQIEALITAHTRSPLPIIFRKRHPGHDQGKA